VAKTHPHIDQPSDDQVRAAVPDRTEAVRETYIALHQVVVETLPEVTRALDTVDAQIGYGAHQYGYNGWGLAAITPYSKWVTLTLLAGSRLADPAGLLEGSSASMRHVKVRSTEHLAAMRSELKAFLTAAAHIHDDPTAARR
jgi:hypothetical protein